MCMVGTTVTQPGHMVNIEPLEIGFIFTVFDFAMVVGTPKGPRSYATIVLNAHRYYFASSWL